jgi:lipoyl(octanoyl) transferase
MQRRGTLDVAWLGRVDYAAALELQDAMVAARLSGLIGDTILLLEHLPVFTMGRGADVRYLLREIPGVPVYRVSRGGQVTYHGPGQLVAYPILKLEGSDRDVHVYLRALEQAMMDSLAKFAIRAVRRPGQTGVWVDDRKIGSIGVGIRRWVTLHGLALNVCPELKYFDAMVPCGIAGCRMTSMEREGVKISAAAVRAALAESFAAIFGFERVGETDARRLWALVESRTAEREAQP